MEKETAVVVIPIYKIKLSQPEEDSINQTLSVLKQHKIVLVTHKELNLDYYKNVFKKHNKEFLVEFFDKNYFANIQGYNQLCLSQEFYKRFINYEYMLICQTDAWVFKDELLYWCSKGYDYIGAPLNKDYTSKSLNFEIKNAGNGGFCLRKIDSTLKLMGYGLCNKNVNFYKTFKNVFNYKRKKKLISNIINIPIFIFYWTFQAFIKWRYAENEDFVIAYYAPKYYPEYKIAEDNIACKFSIEIHAKELLEINNYELPFGSHGYNNYEKVKKLYAEHILMKEEETINEQS